MPTLDQINAASHYQICAWYRFLPSPGTSAIGKSNFQEVLNAEVLLMNRIAERLKEFGGFTPEISKSLGWDN